MARERHQKRRLSVPVLKVVQSVPAVSVKAQMLVLAGGRATRVRADGHDVAGPGKAFEEKLGKNLLWFTLAGARAAGVRRVVVCGDTQDAIELIKLTRLDLMRNGCSFDMFRPYLDPGAGVQGQAARLYEEDLLEDSYIGVFGHNPVPPSDLQRLATKRHRLIAVRGKQQAVYSSERQFGIEEGPPKLTWPMTGHRDFALTAPDHNFNELEIVTQAWLENRLGAVGGSWPVEFDNGRQYSRFMNEMGSHLLSLVYPMPVQSTSRVEWKLPNLLGPDVVVDHTSGVEL